MKSTSSKRVAPKSSNRVQKKVIKNKDQPSGKKVGKKKKSKIKDKENQRTKEKQTKRKKSHSKNTPARVEQSTEMLSCEKSKSDVKSSKSNVSAKSTIYSSIVNSSEGVLESPQKKVSPELSSTFSPFVRKSEDHKLKKQKKRNKAKLLKRLSRIWGLKSKKELRIDEKIREELENGKNIASIVEFINTTVDVEPKISFRKKPLKANHEICKKHLKKPYDKRKTVSLSEEAHARRDTGKEQKTLKHKRNKKEKETLKHKDHIKIIKHFASKIKTKVPTDKSKNNNATINNIHDNCNNDAKQDLKFMSSILKIFNIPRKSREKGLEKHMLHFLYEHYRTFLNKYLMIPKFRKSDTSQNEDAEKYIEKLMNEDVEKAIEILNKEIESAFPPLIEEFLIKTIQENSSVQHAFCRSSESNKADELKVLDTENTVSNKADTTGVDENNHSEMKNYYTFLNYTFLNPFMNYVRILNENRDFINRITNSQFVRKYQHEQKNINELTEKESSITSDAYPQYFVSNDQHQQNNINELTEKESSITCNTDPQYYEQNGSSKPDENAHPQTNDNYLQNIVPMYGPIEKGTKLDENAHSPTNNTNPQKSFYEDIDSNSEDEDVSVDRDPSSKHISFQDNLAENYIRILNETRDSVNGITNSQFVQECQHEQKNINELTENVSSITSDAYPQYFVSNDQHQQNNINELTERESSITCITDRPYSMLNHYYEQNGTSKPDQNAHPQTNDNYVQNIVPMYGPLEKDTCSLDVNAHSLTNDTNPQEIVSLHENIESNSSSEDENVFVAGDTSPKHFSFQDNFAESNSSSEDENVSVDGDISPKRFSYSSEWNSYENTCYSTKEVISERLEGLRASMFYNIF